MVRATGLARRQPPREAPTRKGGAENPLGADEGMVDVDLGSDTESTGGGRAPSPFCVVSAGGGEAQRTFADPGGGSSPEWNHKLNLNLGPGTAALTVDILDEEGGVARPRGCCPGLDRQLSYMATGTPAGAPKALDGVGDGATPGRNPAFAAGPARRMGRATVDLTKALQNWVDCQECAVQGADGRAAGTLELGLVFLPVLYQGWMKKASAVLRVWEQYWFELLGDGRLVYWKSPRKRARDHAGTVYLEDSFAVSLAPQYQKRPDGRAYFQVDSVDAKTNRPRTYFLKCESPREAQTWIGRLQEVWNLAHAQLPPPDQLAADAIARILPAGVGLYL